MILCKHLTKLTLLSFWVFTFIIVQTHFTATGSECFAGDNYKIEDGCKFPVIRSLCEVREGHSTPSMWKTVSCYRLWTMNVKKEEFSRRCWKTVADDGELKWECKAGEYGDPGLTRWYHRYTHAPTTENKYLCRNVCYWQNQCTGNWEPANY